MTALTGKQAVMETLRAHGVQYVFGNPGTSESPFLDALQDYPDIQYVLALQESVAVGMADGYARATHRPALINVHVSAGLANALCLVSNACRGGTPLVVTAGQWDTRLLLEEPVLGADLARMAEQFTKWSAEVHHTADLSTALRRAFQVAAEPPSGPVFLSLPWDVLDATTDAPVESAAPAYHRHRPDASAVERAASFLAHARRPAIIVGDRVAQSDATAEAVALAELLGAPVYSTTYSGVNFPNAHPQFLGSLNVHSHATRDLLAMFDVVLGIGTNLFSRFLYASGRLFGPETRLVHVDSHAREIGKTYRADVGMVADPKTALVELTAAVDTVQTDTERDDASTRCQRLAAQRRQKDEAFIREVRAHWDARPIHATRLMAELRDCLPPHSVIVDEAISNSGVLHASLTFREPGDFFRASGGAISWGMGGALGVQLALPDRPVVAVIGDGSAMYCNQALWTAAHYRLPVKYIILSNRAYRVLKINLVHYRGEAAGRSKFIGMDLCDPDLDFARLAASFDLPAWRLDQPDAIRPTLERAFATPGPALIDARIDGSYNGFF
ncbi:MAG: thiamine pyrophosphate-binding protein [Chloroflexi bacterium]|nr:thiamine pyrophosphate-binding protein [Chloroflexota bacterium]